MIYSKKLTLKRALSISKWIEIINKNLFFLLFVFLTINYLTLPTDLFSQDSSIDIHQIPEKNSKSTSEKKSKFKYNISICTIFQNEGPYLKEWIDYHRIIGVEHFYLYNHHSTDNYKTVLAPYIKAGIVELIDFCLPGHPQNQMIEDALSRSKKKTKWLASLDADELIVPKNHETLTEFLKDYEEFAGVSINWQIFGTSHVPSIPSNELMIDHLIFKAETNYCWNMHVKLVVQPKRVASVWNAHVFTYKSPHYVVRPDKTIQPHDHGSPVQVDKIAINHYWTRDDHFFYNTKIPRHLKFGWSKETMIELNNNDFNLVLDRFCADKYGKKLKNFMAKPIK